MSRRPEVSRRRSPCPACESLESRALLSATALHAGMGSHPAAEIRPAHVTALAGTSILPTSPNLSVSTVPANGDVNPYGVAFVPRGFPSGGTIRAGDILVSNFNAKSGLQGTGTTIVDVAPDGTSSVFFQKAGTGLTEALGVLRRGFVIVGSLPSADGTAGTLGAGSLLLLDRNGNLVASTPAISGPWGLAVNDQGSRAQVFVSNVLDGTVTRFDLKVGRDSVSIVKSTQIASGYVHRADPAAFEIGPTALAYDAARDTLYVAATGDNQVFAIPRAGRTRVDNGVGNVAIHDQAHLHGPIGLALGPQGTIIVINGDAVNADPNQPSEVVLYSRRGRFLAQQPLNPGPDAGFGIAFQTAGRLFTFAAVNDITNTVDIFRRRV